MKNSCKSILEGSSRSVSVRGINQNTGNNAMLRTKILRSERKRGFTLVELLVVVLIIGILSSVALPQYTKAVKKARGVQVITTVSSLAKAMNMAYLEDGRYQRHYQSYNGSLMHTDDFDIEIPTLKLPGNGVEINASGSGSSANVFATIYVSGGSSSTAAHLNYYLSNGKIESITCSGSDCSSYFPGTILSQN